MWSLSCGGVLQEGASRGQSAGLGYDWSTGGPQSGLKGQAHPDISLEVLLWHKEEEDERSGWGTGQRWHSAGSVSLKSQVRRGDRERGVLQAVIRVTHSQPPEQSHCSHSEHGSVSTGTTASSTSPSPLHHLSPCSPHPLPSHAE